MNTTVTQPAAGLNSTSEPANTGKRFVEQAKKTGQEIQEMGGMAKDYAGEKFEQIRESASQHMDDGKEKALQMEQTIEQYIRECPVKSVLIAASVGLLLGRFWIRH